MKTVLAMGIVMVLCFAQVSFAQVPRTISYQGVLKDDTGAIVPTDDYEFTFRLYDASSGGTPLWTETQTKHVSAGILNAVLGEVNPITLPFDAQYWLGVTIGAGSELTPRTMLTGAPYALNARAVLGTHNEFPDSGYVGIGTTSPASPLHIVSPSEIRALRVDGGVPGSWALIQINAADANSLPGIEYWKGGAFKGVNYIDTDNDWILRLGATNILAADGISYNVGVGVDEPTEKLDVDGALRLGTTANTNAGSIRWTGADFEGYDGSAWQSLTAGGSGGDLPPGTAGQTLRHDGAAWIATGHLYNSGDRIGIGTTSPSAELEVVGDNMTSHFKLTAPTGAGPAVYFNAANRDWTIFGSNPSCSAGDRKLIFRDFSLAQNRLVIDEYGHVGVNEDYPDATLHIAGGSFDVGGTEGDLKIGDDTYRLKIGIATAGDSAGFSRLYSDGGYNRIGLGGGWAPDIVSIFPSVNPGNTGYMHVGNDSLTGELSVWRKGFWWAGVTLKSNEYGGSIVCYDDQGAGAAWLRADPDGSGVILELKRGHLENGFAYYGNVDGSELPVVYIFGEGRWITFDMTVTGDSCVSLPPDVIASHEIKDEPGTASAVEGTSSVTLDGSLQTLLYRSITAPADGYVQVIATGQANINHARGTESLADFGVSQASDLQPANQDVMLQLPDSAATGTYAFPVTVHGLFEVTSGAHTFYFLGQEGSGDFRIYDMQLTLTYIPTAYGMVVSTLTERGGTPDELAPNAATVTGTDVSSERRECRRINRNRIERELAAMREEIERLKLVLERESRDEP